MKILHLIIGWHQFQIRRVAKCDDCGSKINPGAQVFGNNDLRIVEKNTLLCFICGTKRGLEK